MRNPNLVYVDDVFGAINSQQNSEDDIVIDFNKMKIFDSAGKEISQLFRSASGVWDWKSLDSKSGKAMIPHHQVELEKYYNSWLAGLIVNAGAASDGAEV